LKIQIKYKNQNDELQEIRGSPFYAAHKVGLPAKNNEMSGASLINQM